MNVISQFGEHSAKQITSMPLSLRFMAGLLVVVVAVCAVWTLSVYDIHDKSFILGKLSADEIRRAEEAFGKAELNDYEVVNGSQLRVPSSRKAEYLRALSSAEAMPSAWGDSYKDSLQPKLFESMSDREWRHELLRERALEEILCRRPEIDSAFVEYDEVKAGFTQECTRTCCIHVQQKNGQPIPDAVLQSIREAATKYFAGLTGENVSVVDLGTSYLSQNESASQMHADNPLLALKAQWEEYYLNKVRELLVNYGDVKVGVTVDLANPKTDSPLQQEPSESAPTEIRSVIRKRLEVQSDEASQFAMPPESERSGSLNRPQSIVSRTEETEETKITRSETKTTAEALAAIRPSSVRISIGVPESQYLKIFRHRQRMAHPEGEESQNWPAPNDEELAELQIQVKQVVQAAIEGIPPRPGFTPLDSENSLAQASKSSETPWINVYSYPDLPEEVPPPADLLQQATLWFADSWATLVLLGLTISCLGWAMLWMRSPTSPTSPISSQPHASAGANLDTVISDEPFDRASPPAVTPISDETTEHIKEDLSELIRKHPEAAKTLLKTWLGDAA